MVTTIVVMYPDAGCIDFVVVTPLFAAAKTLPSHPRGLVAVQILTRTLSVGTDPMRGEEEATEAGAGANSYALQNMDFHPEIRFLQRGQLESYIGVVSVNAVTTLSDLYRNNPVLLSAIGGDKSLL